MLKASNILTLGAGRKLIESWFLRKLEVIVTNPMGVTTLTQACISSKQCLNILQDRTTTSFFTNRESQIFV